MNFMNRMLSSFFVLSALLLTGACLSVDWLLELGVLNESLGNGLSLLEEQRKSEQLHRESQEVLERIDIKAKISQALSDGEITLKDAAVCFRSLHEDPKSWRHPNRPRPQLNDGEAWRRETIDWVTTYVSLEQSSSHADELRQRLEAELQTYLECHDTVLLPE